MAGEFYGVMTKMGESGRGQWHEGGSRREQGWEQEGGRRGGLMGSKGGSGQLRAAGNGRMQGERVRVVVGGKGGKVHLQQGRPVSVRGTGQAGEGNGAGVQWTEMSSSNACLKVIVAGGLCGVLLVL